MAQCPSCRKTEWFFTDNDGVEHVETSHYRALQLRKKVGVPGSPIKSRKKTKSDAGK